MKRNQGHLPKKQNSTGADKRRSPSAVTRQAIDARRYRNILDTMRESYFEVDLKGNLVFFTDRVISGLGYSEEELQNGGFRKFVDETDAKRVFDAFKEVFLTGRPLHGLECGVLKSNKEKMEIECSVNLIRDESGQPTGFRGVVRDISARKQAEKKLQESEGKYREILQNLDEAYLETDLRGNYVFFNDSLCRMLGYSRQELQNISFTKIDPPGVHDKTVKAFNEIYRTGNTKRFIAHAVTCKDGSARFLETTASLRLSPDGEPVGFRMVSRDITEKLEAEKRLKHSEQRLQLITDHVTDMIWTMDFDMNLTYISPSVTAMLGFTPEEILQTPLTSILNPDVYALVKRKLAEGLALEAQHVPDEETATTVELPVRRKDGGSVWVEISAAFNRDEEGRLIEIVGVTRDITKRKKAEEALRKNEKRYRMLAENIHDVVWIIGLDLTFKYASPSQLKLLGWTSERARNITVRDVVSPEGLDLIFRVMTEELTVETSGNPFDPNRSRTIEVEAYAEDGHSVWLELTGTFNRDANGRPTEILAMGRDITQRRNMERTLAENEKRFRMMAESINDVVWIAGMDLKLRYVSPSNVKVGGYTPEEALQLQIQDVVTPESLERVVRVLSEELALENSGEPFDPHRSRTVEIEAYAKGGQLIWLEVTGTFNRNADGKPTEILAVGRNITQRKNMERALSQSERRYRMIAENMNDIVWTIGLDLQFRYVSPSSAWVTGYTPEEALGTPLTKLITPESYACATTRLAEELALEAGGQPFDPNRAITMEVEAVRKDGSTYWLEITGTFNRDKTGEITEILVVGRNISARREAEKALAETQRLYRVIVENIKDSVSLLDLDFNYLFVSPSEVRITGYLPEELMKIPIREQVTPESNALMDSIFVEEIAREYSGEPVDPNRTRTVEVEVYHKNGGKVWVELVFTFTRDESGKPDGLLRIARDITERRKIQDALRQSENRYRSILDSIQEVIWTTDLELKTTYVSPSCLQITGYTPEEAREIPLSRLLTPDSFDYAQRLLAEELTMEVSGEPVDPYRTRVLEVEMSHKNGGTVLLEVTATFTRDKDETASGLLLAGRDITGRKKAQEEKELLERQLVQAQKMESVGRLAGGVAHDFNNMLSVILGYIDIAKRKLVRQHPVLSDLGEIEKAALRSRDITAQLLAFSRKQIITPVVLDLNELVSDTQKALIRLIGEDIHLDYHPAEDLWAVRFDPSQIEQILINLAINARDAMPDGGRLTIETANIVLDKHYCDMHAGFKPGEYVRLTVSDSGTGMDKETLQYIFEPFFTTKEEGRGTGLGLATVYGIVKQNDGFINVYSEPGQGTTFTIYLPRTTEEKPPELEAEEDQALNGTGHILLVEDDPMVLEITREMLESLEYTVTVAKDPLDALSICERDPSVDLVITDVVMPVMKGKELKERLIRIRPEIKVLFMSGYTANVIAHHGVLEDGVHFLQKPFTIRGLGKKVKEVLSSGLQDP